MTTATRICPVCIVELERSQKQGVEIDYCPVCRGVWLDRGELEKIVDRTLREEASYGQTQGNRDDHDYPDDRSYDRGHNSGHRDRHYDNRQDDRHRSGHHGDSYGDRHHGSGHRRQSFLGDLFDL